VAYVLAVTRDGQHIISGSWDKTVKVWSVATKSLVSTCRGHADAVVAVAAMPDGKRILSSGHDQSIQVWRIDGTRQNTFRLHYMTVRTLAALPDNQHALSGSADETVKLFNVNDGVVLRTFTQHKDPWTPSSCAVWSLALLPDGLRFVSGSADGTARIAYHGLAPHPQCGTPSEKRVCHPKIRARVLRIEGHPGDRRRRPQDSEL
jgi:WD40 repeat protein